MPKVLHVVPYMDEAAGGPPVVVRRLLIGAREAGWDAEVITCPDYSNDGGAQLGREPAVTVLPSQLAVLSGKGRAKLEQAIKSADLIHCHTLWSTLVTKAARIARKLGKPYVLSPHGMLDPYSFAQKKWKKRLYLEAFERRTILDASRVLLTAEKERVLAETTFGEIPNAAVVPLGADPLPSDKAELSERFFEAHPDLREKQILLFMGRLHPKKRPDILLDVMKDVRAKLPGAVLLFAGTGDDAYVAMLKARRQQLELEERAQFLGHLSGNAKFATLAAADLFLLPSHQENFAIAVAEALHAGTPVILTRHVNIWQEIVDAEAGMAVDDDDLKDKLVDAVCSLLANRDKFDGMSTNAFRLAEDQFTWEHSSERTLEVYEGALGRP